MLKGSCHCGTVCWTIGEMPESVTACNCTVCRRYGTLWAYGHEGEEISVSGATRSYTRAAGVLEFHFCANCGCVAAWRSKKIGRDGRRRMAVNVRLAEPGPLAHLPIDHFDGLDSFDDLPRDGRCVSDMWF
jgi:hypothetical protein